MTGQAGIAALTERHRHELHVYGYRMLASFDDAGDAVQETFLIAGITTFGPALFPAVGLPAVL